jgi:O-antigen/teichoic acid export membrane protein
VPHGLLVQVQNLIDRWLLLRYVSRAVVGQYGIAYSLGEGVKLALSAFEPAWGPFVYSRIRDPDAPVTLARVITWAWLFFALAGTGVAVFAFELLAIFTSGTAFLAGASVIPVVALAYLLHGVFLLTSIGIGVKKRTRWYPVITAASASTNVIANLVLIPRLGMMGSAWATVASYAVMAGLGFWISRRLYPLPLEWGRLSRISAAALAVFAASQLVPGGALAVAIAVKAGLLLALPALLLASGFATDEERRALREGVARWRRGDGPKKED